ncbi:MAG: hypothetical protein STHCBS139747_007650 [Sporothrix thermara]
MAPSYRGRPGVRIAAPKSSLIQAISNKRANEAASAAAASKKSKRPQREPVAVDAPPLSSSDEEDDISDSSAAATVPELERRRGSGRRNGDGDENNSDASSSQRGTKRRRQQLREEENEYETVVTATEKASVGDVTSMRDSLFARPVRPTLKATYGGRKASSTSSSTIARTKITTSTTITATIRSASQPSKPVFKKYEDDTSDLSEPDEPDEPEPEQKSTKASAKDGKARKRAALSPGGSSSLPPPTARFIKPPELTPERELSAEEAEKLKATPPKFKHSKWAHSDSEEENTQGNGKKDDKTVTEPKKFQHSKYTLSDDEGSTTSSTKERPRPTKTVTEKSSLNVKVAKKASKGQDDSFQTDVKELFKSRQPWRQKLEGEKKEKKKTTKKKLGTTGREDKVDSKSSRVGQLEVEKKTPPPAPRAVFKMPTFDNFSRDATERDGDDSRGAEDGSDIYNGDNENGDNDDNDANASDDTLAYKGPAVCPLCKAPLDEDVLRDLLAGHHLLVGIAVGRAHVVQLNLLKFDEKLRFCAGHKRRAGRAAWTARGYPVIDWAALPGRLRKHEAHVRQVILGTTPSPFCVAWEEAAATAAGAPASTSTSTSVSLSTSIPTAPGYYGRRGLRVLSDAIVQRHASTLSRRAIEDPLVAARGMVQFVQAVLVPELAVQLIREDLQAAGGAGFGLGNKGQKTKRSNSLDEARRILHESAALGEEVMDEERDVIEDDDDDDDDDDDEDGKDRDSDVMSL